MMLKDLPWKTYGMINSEEARAVPLRDGTYLHILKSADGLYDIYHDIDREGEPRRALRQWYNLDALTAQCIVTELHRNPER